MSLTPVEFRLLHYLMYYPGEIISAERLLREVWGYPPGVGSTELVRTHIKNIRAKLAVSAIDPYRVVRTIPSHGYMIFQDGRG